MDDPYKILGVAKNASEADIKKAFRTLAKKHHPDKHAGDAAAQKKFQEISGAYDILGDKEKRAQFDAGAIGADGNPRGFDPRQQGGFRQGNPFGGGGTRRIVLQNGEQLDVKIPVGVKDGQVVRIKGRGGAGRGGAPNGDILLNVSVAPHPGMTRDGNDIRTDLPITLKEAVLGGKVPVPTLTGTVSLSVPPNSNTGTMLRLKGKGIAAHGTTPAGDLYVRLVVTLPAEPDEALRDFTSKWTADYDPRAKTR
jgi:DnaJ-class molecular chaperone